MEFASLSKGPAEGQLNMTIMPKFLQAFLP